MPIATKNASFPSQNDATKEHNTVHKKATAYLNKLCQSPLEADQRLYRLYRAAECFNPKELALFLGVSTTTISKVKKTGKIPAEWLLLVFQVKNVFPEWIQTGLGDMHLERTPEGHYESGHTFHERMEDEAALRRLSSRALTEELLRRIALGG